VDKLTINGLELWVKVGCSAAERAFPQRLSVDVEMSIDLQKAGRKDDIRETVDYAATVKRAQGVVAGRSYKLIEAVAEDISRAALADKKARQVTVRVTKRALPGIESACVEIQRARPV
jgi:7,8-dihydroneopterin aldolase/epimerase/oxygenase